MRSRVELFEGIRRDGRLEGMSVVPWPRSTRCTGAPSARRCRAPSRRSANAPSVLVLQPVCHERGE